MVEPKTKAAGRTLVILVLSVFNLCPCFAKADGAGDVVTGHFNVIAIKVKGTVTYTKDGVSRPLKWHARLLPGTSITAGPHSMADLTTDDSATVAVVRLQGESTLIISNLDKLNTEREAASLTQFRLKSGSLLGHFKTLSPNTIFELRLPDGIAGIRGSTTDFAATVSATPDGTPSTLLTCVKGKLLFATSPETNSTLTLHDGQCYQSGLPGAQPTPPSPMADYAKQINAAVP